MKLEQQVVNLDLSKQLKEAGYKQEGLWWWVERFRQDLSEQEPYYVVEQKGIPYRDSRGGQKIIYVAPTVAELGKHFENYKGSFSFYKGTNCWIADLLDSQAFYEDTEADCRAKMWLYLKENKLL